MKNEKMKKRKKKERKKKKKEKKKNYLLAFTESKIHWGCTYSLEITLLETVGRSTI